MQRTLPFSEATKEISARILRMLEEGGHTVWQISKGVGLPYMTVYQRILRLRHKYPSLPEVPLENKGNRGRTSKAGAPRATPQYRDNKKPQPEAAPVMTSRRCLSCERMFKSCQRASENRICEICKEAPEWRFSSVAHETGNIRVP